MLWLIFAFFFHFFLFSISQSNVIHREICVKDFSGTTAPRILKFGINIGYDLLYCVKENQHAAAYHSFYLSIFLSLQANFLLQISHLLWEPESSNFVYTWPSILGQKTKLLRFIFFPFSISHSNVIYIGKFVINISQELLHIEFCNLAQMLWIICCFMWKRTRLVLLILPLISSFFFLSNFQISNNFISLFPGTERPTKLKLGSHMDSRLVYHVYLNQAAGAYLFFYFFNFLSLKFPNIKFFVILFCEAYKVENWYTYGQWVDLLRTPKYKQPEYTCSFIFFFFLSFQLAKIKKLA